MMSCFSCWAVLFSCNDNNEQKKLLEENETFLRKFERMCKLDWFRVGGDSYETINLKNALNRNEIDHKDTPIGKLDKYKNSLKAIDHWISANNAKTDRDKSTRSDKILQFRNDIDSEYQSLRQCAKSMEKDVQKHGNKNIGLYPNLTVLHSTDPFDPTNEITSEGPSSSYHSYL